MNLQISSKTQGAELTSIKFKGKEILHQGKEYWNRHAPILFPIVGQIKNGETKINNKTYKMGQHGFARDMEFQELEKTDQVHKYVLKSNSQTLEKFPFKFELYVTYTINESKLITEYKVINKDENKMIFGLGGHPAFICDYSSENYEIQFEKNEDNIEFLQLENGLISDKPGKNIINSNKIELKKDSFINDAIIMKNIKSDKVILKDNLTNKEILKFDFTGFPYLALWSKKGAPFVCIEPWFNTADRIDSTGNFEEKENIIKLDPNKEFSCKYTVEFY